MIRFVLKKSLWLYSIKRTDAGGKANKTILETISAPGRNDASLDQDGNGKGQMDARESYTGTDET